jgi:hypothetical protein
MKKENHQKTRLVVEYDILHQKERCYHVLKESIGSGS